MFRFWDIRPQFQESSFIWTKYKSLKFEVRSPLLLESRLIFKACFLRFQLTGSFFFTDYSSAINLKSKGKLLFVEYGRISWYQGIPDDASSLKRLEGLEPSPSVWKTNTLTNWAIVAKWKPLLKMLNKSFWNGNVAIKKENISFESKSINYTNFKWNMNSSKILKEFY